MTQVDNLVSKVTRLYVVHRSYTPDGQNEPIEYDRLVLEYLLDGEVENMELKASSDKLKLLRLADTVTDQKQFETITA